MAPSTIEGAGMGLFSGITFQKGELITVYLGEKVGEKEPNNGNGKRILYEDKDTKKQLLDITETNKKVTPYLGAHYCNDAAFGKTGSEREQYLDINKMKVPKINCDMEGLGVYATKEIRPEEEIFLDYGEDYYKN